MALLLGRSPPVLGNAARAERLFGGRPTRSRSQWPDLERDAVQHIGPLWPSKTQWSSAIFSTTSNGASRRQATLPARRLWCGSVEFRGSRPRQLRMCLSTALELHLGGASSRRIGRLCFLPVTPTAGGRLCRNQQARWNAQYESVPNHCTRSSRGPRLLLSRFSTRPYQQRPRSSLTAERRSPSAQACSSPLITRAAHSSSVMVPVCATRARSCGRSTSCMPSMRFHSHSGVSASLRGT